MVNLLNQQKDKEFEKLLNSIDMWRGSGGVREVHIEDRRNAREFEIEMVKLIDFMEDTKMLGKGIKPIRKILKKDIQ